MWNCEVPEDVKTKSSVARRNDSQVLIDFKDHGNGIPESVQGNLFQPFYTTKSSGRGKGLGLFISEAILREINGSISFVSHAHEGATFIVKLNVPE